MNIEQQRAAFEAWHRQKFATRHSTGQPTRDMHNGVYDKNYGPVHQQHMWEAFQAAIELDRQGRGEPVAWRYRRLSEKESADMAGRAPDSAPWYLKEHTNMTTALREGRAHLAPHRGMVDWQPLFDCPQRSNPIGWIHEDELPDGYPYDAMYPFSKIDGVRLFPVYAPQPAEPAIKESLTAAEPVEEPSDYDLVRLFSEVKHNLWAFARLAIARYGNAAPTPPADGQAQQCHKSHPHGNMDAECQLLTAQARETSQARQAVIFVHELAMGAYRPDEIEARSKAISRMAPLEAQQDANVDMPLSEIRYDSLEVIDGDARKRVQPASGEDATSLIESAKKVYAHAAAIELLYGKTDESQGLIKGAMSLVQQLAGTQQEKP